MINIELIGVSGIDGAIAGMRNPFKNREKSDSEWKRSDDDEPYEFVIGEKDMELCHKLIASGGDSHSKFMRMIHVQADIRAPLYWWKEFDTYKVATVANSESTMHTIHSRPFTEDDFAHDMLIDGYTMTQDKKDFVDEYSLGYIYNGDEDLAFTWTPTSLLDMNIQALNTIRALYLAAKADGAKSDAYNLWYNMIQLLPSSYMQLRTVDLDYQTLRRIYFERRHHKLHEWSRDFCGWVECLPYADELITWDSLKEDKAQKFKVTQDVEGRRIYTPVEEKKDESQSV